MVYTANGDGTQMEGMTKIEAGMTQQTSDGIGMDDKVENRGTGKGKKKGMLQMMEYR